MSETSLEKWPSPECWTTRSTHRKSGRSSAAGFEATVAESIAAASPTQLQTTTEWTKKSALPPTRRNSETPAVTLPPRTEVEATPVSAKRQEFVELEETSLPTVKERRSTHEAESSQEV